LLEQRKLNLAKKTKEQKHRIKNIFTKKRDRISRKTKKELEKNKKQHNPVFPVFLLAFFSVCSGCVFSLCFKFLSETLYTLSY
jgi:hypothetical protein